jgi:hypothetical protein
MLAEKMSKLFRAKRLGRAAAAALVLLASGLATASPDPYEIFARAREFWLHQRYPATMRYVVAVDVVEGGKERVERYDAAYDAVNNVISVDPVSDYERNHPQRPSGIGLSFFGIQLGKPLPPIDFMGVPHLAPNYSFGMAPFVPAATPTPFNSMALVAEIRREFHDPNPRATPTPSPSPTPAIPLIAEVVAFKRNYAISLLGTQTIDGHPCYHLQLQPMRDPGRFRLRQAWIDERDYATWQLQEALNFKDGPGTDVPWTIHFTSVDGAQYIREEVADGAMATGGEIYTHTAIRFESLRPAAGPGVAVPLEQSGTALEEPP